MPFTIESGAESDLGPCACCGGRTRVVRGFVHDRSGARAAYLVRWAPGRPQHRATVAVSIGPWGGASAAERSCFVFDHSVTDGPAFTITDAGTSAFAGHAAVLGQMISRDAASHSPLKTEVLEILDAIGEQDTRVNGWWLDSKLH